MTQKGKLKQLLNKEMIYDCGGLTAFVPKHHVDSWIDEAKKEFPHITQLKYQNWFNKYGALAAESLLNQDRSLWFKNWFGADK